MRIDIICYRNVNRRSQITKAVNMSNSVQNYFFYCLNYVDHDVCETQMVNWPSFRHSHTRADLTDDKHYAIYITEKRFDDNWFSHEEHCFSLISTYDWENHYAPPSLSAYLMYQIAQASITFNADMNEIMEMNMVHDYAEGCMFDFCLHKPDIKLGMVAGTICPKCRVSLLCHGIDKRAIDSAEQILSYIRAEAIGKPVHLKEHSAFVVMRFSQNDENANSYQYGIQAAFHELGIACEKGNDIVMSGQILDKVKTSIEQSRFIVIKVDSENLNVYFELGLAMGLNKDVLLISEEGFAIQLPTDLKNWECLTYPKGDYSELKNRIKKYYKDHYHY